LDPAGFAEWSQGSESATAVEGEQDKILWTSSTASDWGGVAFGDNTTPGTRHLRLAWKTAVTCGTVLVRGGGTLSVLRADAEYPGDLSDDSQWLPAERISGNEITSAAVTYEEYAMWVLPPRTTTRALRFTHIAASSDPQYTGRLGGALVLSGRFANIAPQAIAAASTMDQRSHLINNSSNDKMWETWRNGESGATEVISAERPEWLQLT